MKPRAVLMFVVIVSVYLLLNFYIGWHGALLLDMWGFPGAGIYWSLFTVVAFSYLIGRTRLLPGPAGRLLKVIGSYYFALMEFAVFVLPVADLAAWLLKLSGRDVTFYVPVVGIGVLVVLAVLFARGTWNAWSPIIRTYPIALDKKAGDRKHLRIAVASDLHLGSIVGKRHLRKLVARMKAMEPDLILLPGDVMDDSIEPFVRNNMAEVLGQLKAPLGIYAVLGNHEYYGGHIEEYVQRMEAIGIRVLRDETVSVDDTFYIAGRKDRTAESADPDGRLSVSGLLAGLNLSRPVFLMDHQPYRFDLAATAGADVLLCGHTHRGQFAPNHWVTKRLFELDWGYLLKDKLHVVVSSGYGTWGPPIRIASRSEILELNVTFG